MGRVLVLEDDDPQRRLMRDLLQDEGHGVCVVSTLEACLGHATEHEHDLIIADLQLGRSLVPLAELIPLSSAVLVVSGHPAGEVRAQAAGAEALLKPYDIDELARVVRRLMPTASRLPL